MGQKPIFWRIRWLVRPCRRSLNVQNATHGTGESSSCLSECKHRQTWRCKSIQIVQDKRSARDLQTLPDNIHTFPALTHHKFPNRLIISQNITIGEFAENIIITFSADVKSGALLSGESYFVVTLIALHKQESCLENNALFLCRSYRALSHFFLFPVMSDMLLVVSWRKMDGELGGSGILKLEIEIWYAFVAFVRLSGKNVLCCVCVGINAL